MKKYKSQGKALEMTVNSREENLRLLRSPGIDFWRAGKTTLFDVLARQATWACEIVPWNRFLGSLNVYKFGL